MWERHLTINLLKKHLKQIDNIESNSVHIDVVDAFPKDK
jgi:hypothetical protein